jgi:4-hydroxybenzoate polyprenyltransferase
MAKAKRGHDFAWPPRRALHATHSAQNNTDMMRRMFSQIALILRMIKFSHTVFAMPFAVMSAFLAGQAGLGGFCGWPKLLLIVLCMVFARTVAMTFNRIADAAIDARNPRTANRAIPAGRITLTKVWAFLAANAALFVAATALFWKPLAGVFGFGNPWPLVFSLPTLLFICLYSFTKRFTWLSHFWLGASLMLAPIGAWLAVSPPEGPPTSVYAWLIGVSVLLWTAGFDIIYACQDVEIDRRDGLYSLPANLGVASALWISRSCHLVAIILLALLIRHPRLGSVYAAAVVLAAVLIVAEHILVRRGRLAYLHIAFGTLNGAVSVLLAIATLYDIFR